MSVNARQLYLQVGGIAMTTLILMTIYEWAKQLLFPAISIWGSHTITILFTTFLATIISFFVLRKLHKTYQERLHEASRRKATEENYHLLFEQSHDAIAITTSTGHYISVNPAYERLFGYRSDELEHLNAAELWVDENERSRWIANMETYGFVTDYECLQLRKDGSEIVVQRTSSQRRETNGRLIYQSICREITEQKRLMAEREELVKELQEALSKVRTLSGMLPICASCKSIRDDRGYWQQLEDYISEYSDTVFSHGVCPTCAAKLYPEFINENNLPQT